MDLQVQPTVSEHLAQDNWPIGGGGEDHLRGEKSWVETRPNACFLFKFSSRGRLQIAHNYITSLQCMQAGPLPQPITTITCNIQHRTCHIAAHGANHFGSQAPQLQLNLILPNPKCSHLPTDSNLRSLSHEDVHCPLLTPYQHPPSSPSSIFPTPHPPPLPLSLPTHTFSRSTPPHPSHFRKTNHAGRPGNSAKCRPIRCKIAHLTQVPQARCLTSPQPQAGPSSYLRL